MRGRKHGLPHAVLLLGLLLTSVACARQSTPVPAATPTPDPPPSVASASAIPPFGHVFVILMENKSYADIIGSPDAPFINQLALTYAVAANYYAVRHPSLLNYLALVSGSTQGMTWDCPTCSVNAPNLADQLDAHHKTWKAYEEDLPRACFHRPQSGGGILGTLLGWADYVRKHDPWMYFSAISGNPPRCHRVVPLDEFGADLRADRLPDFVWITPNLQHDMHNGSIRDGDTWLASFVPPILASPAWKDNGVLFLLWDEGTGNAGCCGDATGGRTVALVIAASGKHHYQSKIPYSHYSLLRTIEDAWQLGYLGHAGDPGTKAMTDFFGGH